MNQIFIKILKGIIQAGMIPFLFFGCGVRGKPQPPEDSPFIGRGQPQIMYEPKDGDKDNEVMPQTSQDDH